MSSILALQENIKSPTGVVGTVIASLILIVACTWITTSLSYVNSLSTIRRHANTNQKDKAIRPYLTPPLLPYSIPWLGTAMSFLNENPGSFWQLLRRKFAATDIDSCRVMLGGNMIGIISSPTAVQALFRARNVSRRKFNHQVQSKAMGLSKEDLERFDVHLEDRRLNDEGIFTDYLLNQNAVNSLTKKFMEVLTTRLESEKSENWHTINLLDWAKDHGFIASTVALMGSKILELNPDMPRQYWDFDAGMLVRLYGVPRMFRPRAYQAMDDLIANTQKWVEYGLDYWGGEPSLDEEWEPIFGSKIARARQRMHIHKGLSMRGRASMELGFMFGLSSNAIPTVCWMLAHLFSPNTPSHVLPRVVAEIDTAKRSDGTIDVSTLITLPLLNSIFHETLRKYVDVLVTRELHSDLTIDRYQFKKDDVVMAPSYLGHHDSSIWVQDDMPDVDVWYAERFLKRDPETGKDVFSTSGTAGKFFPFGGGVNICPGRVFAKQEVLGALAIILSGFDIEFVEYMEEDKKENLVGKGKSEDHFPTIKRQYTGNGIVIHKGDLKVKVRRRRQQA